MVEQGRKSEKEACGEDLRKPRRGTARIKEELEAVQSELGECREELDQLRDRWMRASADLENTRKRAAREREEWSKFANEGLLRELLPILDNLGRALDHAGDSVGQEGLVEGVRMVERQFVSALEKSGVTPINALDQPFDPSRHEAMMQVESPGHEPNTVVKEMEKGYLFHDRLLRPAKVAVSKRTQA